VHRIYFFINGLRNVGKNSYVLNNPLIYTDPSGYKWWPWAIAADILTGGLVSTTVGLTAMAVSSQALTTTHNLSFLAASINEPLFLNTTSTTFSLTSAALDFTSIFWGTLFSGDTERGGQKFGNWLKIEAGQFLQIPGWETVQTNLGSGIAHVRNITNKVDNVEISHWRVLVNNETNADGWGFTLGPYINAENLTFADQTTMHESGHVKQSRILGPFYMSRVAIPSLFSYQFGSNEYHDNSWFEVWANNLKDIPNSNLYPKSLRHNNFWYWTKLLLLPVYPN
jgi:hypothetical protein